MLSDRDVFIEFQVYLQEQFQRALTRYIALVIMFMFSLWKRN